MPAAASGSEDAEPEMNHRSSPITARRKTRLVVSRGRIGVPVGEESSNLRGRGAKRERVPVPVLQLSARGLMCWKPIYLSGRCSPVSRISRIKSRYWCSSCLSSLVVPGARSTTFGVMRAAASGSISEGAIAGSCALVLYMLWGRKSRSEEERGRVEAFR